MVFDPAGDEDVGTAEALMEALARDAETSGEEFHARFLGPKVVGHNGRFQVELKFPDGHFDLYGLEVDRAHQISRLRTGRNALGG